MKLRVDRVVISGLAQPPDPAELRERVTDELSASLRTADSRRVNDDPVAAIAAAVARAAGGNP